MWFYHASCPRVCIVCKYPGVGRERMAWREARRFVYIRGLIRLWGQFHDCITKSVLVSLYCLLKHKCITETASWLYFKELFYYCILKLLSFAEEIPSDQGETWDVNCRRRVIKFVKGNFLLPFFLLYSLAFTFFFFFLWAHKTNWVMIMTVLVFLNFSFSFLRVKSSGLG